MSSKTLKRLSKLQENLKKNAPIVRSRQVRVFMSKRMDEGLVVPVAMYFQALNNLARE